MDIITIPDFLLGENKEPVNIFFYLREKGPDQIKLKINYSQNMLCFMIRGRKEIIDEAEHYEVNDEQIGLVSSGNMLMTERVTLRQDFESLLLFFSNDFLITFLEKYEISLEDQPDDLPPVITFPKDDYLLNFQQSMKMLEKDFGKQNFRVAKMEEIIVYLLEKYPERTLGFISRSIHKSPDSSLARVVQSHKYDNLNSTELAFLCNMSLSTFKRKFQEKYNTSPKKYVVSEKMKKSRTAAAASKAAFRDLF